MIDVNGRHARKPVGRQVRRQTHVTERWVVVAYAGSVDAVNTEATRQQHHWRDRPVVFGAAILDIGVKDYPVASGAKVSVADDCGCGVVEVIAAVASANLVIGSNLMIQLNVELPSR